MSDVVEIEIDGKKLTAKPGDMLIKVADDAGVHIPRFCYHKKLSVAANCRMCLVDVDNVIRTRCVLFSYVRCGTTVAGAVNLMMCWRSRTSFDSLMIRPSR